jgi:hypothetical protein
VPPTVRFGGFRPGLQQYQLRRDIKVACGRATANTLVKTQDGLMRAGAGGGLQYYLPMIDQTLLQPLSYTITLANWAIKDWSFFIVGGGR